MMENFKFDNINLYHLDLTLHQHGQTSQFLVSRCLHVVFWWGVGNTGVYAAVLSELP